MAYLIVWPSMFMPSNSQGRLLVVITTGLLWQVYFTTTAMLRSGDHVPLRAPSNDNNNSGNNNEEEPVSDQTPMVVLPSSPRRRTRLRRSIDFWSSQRTVQGLSVILAFVLFLGILTVFQEPKTSNRRRQPPRPPSPASFALNPSAQEAKPFNALPPHDSPPPLQQEISQPPPSQADQEETAIEVPPSSTTHLTDQQGEDKESSMPPKISAHNDTHVPTSTRQVDEGALPPSIDTAPAVIDATSAGDSSDMNRDKGDDEAGVNTGPALP